MNFRVTQCCRRAKTCGLVRFLVLSRFTNISADFFLTGHRVSLTEARILRQRGTFSHQVNVEPGFSVTFPIPRCFGVKITALPVADNTKTTDVAISESSAEICAVSHFVGSYH